MRSVEMTRKKSKRGEEGAVAVEAAIILSSLVILIFGIIEFGAAFWQWNTMLYAVEQAGRYVMVNNTTCNTAGCAETQMQTILTSATVCTTPTAGQICVSATPSLAATPPTMTLTAAYNFDLVPLWGFTMQRQATVPLD